MMLAYIPTRAVLYPTIPLWMVALAVVQDPFVSVALFPVFDIGAPEWFLED